MFYFTLAAYCSLSQKMQCKSCILCYKIQTLWEETWKLWLKTVFFLVLICFMINFLDYSTIAKVHESPFKPKKTIFTFSFCSTSSIVLGQCAVDCYNSKSLKVVDIFPCKNLRIEIFVEKFTEEEFWIVVKKCL